MPGRPSLGGLPVSAQPAICWGLKTAIAPESSTRALPMKSFEHLYRLHRLLKRSRHPVPFERVMDELECSRATTKRVIAHLLIVS